MVGTTARGIRTPIIKKGDNLEDIVIDSIMEAQQKEGFIFKDRDIIGITEAVVGKTEGNYVSTDDIRKDIEKKFDVKHIGYVFPSPMSRNRFVPYLKGIARATNKITMLISYPDDEEGNKLFDEELLDLNNINPYSDILNEETYYKLFGHNKHEFTGIDYIAFFRDVCEKENCEIEFIFANNPKVILDYTDNIIVGNVHKRFNNIKILKEAGAKKVLGLHEIMNESINGSGYNPEYGLLGSNAATDESLKLFPITGQTLVNNIQKRLKELTGKTIEILVYGDGAFKDPVGGIWELADPVVSPAFTSGLNGTPSEIKLKYISDNKLSHLNGEELNNAMKKEIKDKANDLIGQNASLGTTPRRLTDLIGSLCDLMSGSGDRGTPVVYIQGYFDTYADD